MSNSSPPHTPPKRATFGTLAKRGATPTRAGNNFVSSTNLGHTQQEIKSSLWGRILRNEPGLITHLIKPHLVENDLVAAIEQALDENTEYKAARDLLFKNEVPEKQMYKPMVSARVGYCGEHSLEKNDRLHYSVISLRSILSLNQLQLRSLIQSRPFPLCAAYHAAMLRVLLVLLHPPLLTNGSIQ